MNILLLGPPREALQPFLGSFGDRVENTDADLTACPESLSAADFIISYGYRFILKREVLDRFPGRAINLHISLLPWNRGADPNLWSFLDDTPKGVSIHFLDPGVDTGAIIAQREVGYRQGDTLRTSYLRLSRAIEQLFMQVWPDIRSGNITATPQRGEGSSHRTIDRIAVEHLLSRGWDTPVAELINRAKGRKEASTP